jgi:hypothetical protein
VRSNQSSIHQRVRLHRRVGAVLCLLLTTQTMSTRAAHAADASPKPEAGKAEAASKWLANRKRQMANHKKMGDADKAAAIEPADTEAVVAAAKSPAAADARRKALVALNTGHYQEAIKALEEAYALDQDPNLLFSLAQAYRLAGQPTKALEACSSYLRSAGPSKTDRLQAELFLAEVTMIAYQIQLQRELGVPGSSSGAAEPKSPRGEIEPPALAQGKAEERPTDNPGEKPDLTPRPGVEHPATERPAVALATSPATEPQPVHHFYESTKFWVVVGAVAVVAGAGLGWWAWERSKELKSPNTGLGYQTAFP